MLYQGLRSADATMRGQAALMLGLSRDVTQRSSIATLPQMADTLASLTGGAAAPKPTVALRPIPMCKGQLAQYLSDQPLGSGAAQTGTRRFFRVEASGAVQRGKTRETRVHIRAVWDAQGFNLNPLCNNHARCNTGTWVYWRID